MMLRTSLQVDDRRGVLLALREIQAGAAALAAEAAAAQTTERPAATIVLLRRGLGIERALARLSRQLALMCARRLTEAGARGDPEAFRTLAQLFPAVGRPACLRCRVTIRRRSIGGDP